MKTNQQPIGTADNAAGRPTVGRRSRGAFSGIRVWGRLGRSLALPTRLALPALLAMDGNVGAQVNTGSDGHDGAFNPTTNTVINMADHPDDIYQYNQAQPD